MKKFRCSIVFLAVVASSASSSNGVFAEPLKTTNFASPAAMGLTKTDASAPASTPPVPVPSGQKPQSATAKPVTAISNNKQLPKLSTLEEIIQKNPAFGEALNQEFPVPPEAIRIHKSIKRDTELAKYPSKPSASKQGVVVASPERTYTMQMAVGFVSTIRLSDNTGEPIKIAGFDAGSDKIISVKTLPPAANGTDGVLALSVRPESHGATNLTIFPVGSSRPLVIDLVIGANQKAIDYQTDFRLTWVAGSAHGYTSSIVSPLTDELLSVLRETPPESFQQMTVTDTTFARAWRSVTPAGETGMVYVKVRGGARLLAPRTFVRNASDNQDGSTAYIFSKAISSLTLALPNGKIVTVLLKG